MHGCRCSFSFLCWAQLKTKYDKTSSVSAPQHAIQSPLSFAKRQKVKQHSLLYKVATLAANWGHVKSSDSGRKLDMILSPKHRQKRNWHEDQPGPRANSGGWLTVKSASPSSICYCSLLLPIFFIGSLRAVSSSLFFPHNAVLGIVMWMSGSSQLWLNDRLHALHQGSA